MPKEPKIRNLHIIAISLEKCGDEVGFLAADKHKRSLQVDSIMLGGQNQACPKYPK